MVGAWRLSLKNQFCGEAVQFLDFQDGNYSIARRTKEKPVIERAEQAVHPRSGNDLVVSKEREISLRVVMVRSYNYHTGRRSSQIEVIDRLVPVMKLKPAGEEKEVQGEKKIQHGRFFSFAQHIYDNISLRH